MGGTKGTLLALVVELLRVALTGAALGFEADSLFTEAGNRPRLGQFLLAVDPGALAGEATYLERVETLVTAMLAEEGVRLPGARRAALLAAAVEGLDVPQSVFEGLNALAA